MKTMTAIATVLLMGATSVQAQPEPGDQTQLTEAQKLRREQRREQRQDQRQQPQAPARPPAAPVRPATAAPRGPAPQASPDARAATEAAQQRQRLQQQPQTERLRQREAAQEQAREGRQRDQADRQPERRTLPPQASDQARQRTEAERAAARERREEQQRRRQQQGTGVSDAQTPRRPRPDRPARMERPERARTAGAGRAQAQRPDFRRRPDRGPDAARPPAGERPRPNPDRRARPNLPTRPDRAEARTDRRASERRAERDRRFDQQRSRELRRGARARAQAQQSRSYRLGRRTYRIVRAAPYRYLGGYRYRVFRRGQRFPAALLLASYFLNNYSSYGLASPPLGYRWVRFGPDAVLVNLGTYEVANTRYGLFYEGGLSYGPDYGYGDQDLPAIDPRLPQEFLTGELQIGDSSGGGCEDFYGSNDWRDYVDQAWADEDWNELAGVVIDSGCESDLGYFLLGLAAEGLVLPEAAASYYQRALDLYDEGGWDNCDAWEEDACRGLDVGEEAARALERLYSQPSTYYDRR